MSRWLAWDYVRSVETGRSPWSEFLWKGSDDFTCRRAFASCSRFTCNTNATLPPTFNENFEDIRTPFNQVNPSSLRSRTNVRDFVSLVPCWWYETEKHVLVQNRRVRSISHVQQVYWREFMHIQIQRSKVVSLNLKLSLPLYARSN